MARPTTNRTARLMINVTPQTRDDIATLAALAGVSITDFVNSVLVDVADKHREAIIQSEKFRNDLEKVAGKFT